MTIVIRRLGRADVDAWLALRTTLWPDGTPDAHRRELLDTLARPSKLAAFGAFADGAIVGFAELSVRDYVDGSDERPCGFLEGLYVVPAHRHTGVARALVAAGEAWLAGLGIRTIGSDALLDNDASIAMHGRLGFVEVERVVRFLRRR
jgi:aminoglycoside 6'-N-acetyltransferase I